MPTPFGPTSPSSITCGGCSNRWTGLNICHCASCHYAFSSLAAFERHRRGSECITPALRGLVPRLRRTGFVAWGFPGTNHTYPEKDS